MPTEIKKAILCAEFKECEAEYSKLKLPEECAKFLRLYSAGTRKNGEHFTRNWLRVSSTNPRAYCMPCSVFSKVEGSPWNKFGREEAGYLIKEFHHSARAVTDHEASINHIESIRAWQLFLKQLKSNTLIQTQLGQIEKDNLNEWRLVLRGILEAVLFCAENNLAFQGSSKNIDDPNCGVFLNTIKLLARHYTPLARHLERMRNKKMITYLSPQSQNEFIALCGAEVRKHILRSIRRRKYYAILFDTTPDTSHIDQVSQVIRSVECNEDGCQIFENFVDFLPTTAKTGAGLTDVIVEKLEKDGLDLSDCRGQGYDGGSNMSGEYSGVQARIIQKTPEAHFQPCAAHSLNRVGVNAADKVKAAKLLLGEIQNIYVYFSSSTQRWEAFTSKCKISLKCQSQTRWSSKARAVSALWEQFGLVLECLQKIEKSDKFPGDTISGAASSIKRLNFKFIVGLCIWNRLLVQIDSCNIHLQKRNVDLSVAQKRLEVLCNFLQEFKQNGFEDCLQESRTVATENNISTDSGFSTVRRGRGVNPRYDDPSRVAAVRAQTNLDRFKTEFFEPLLNKLIAEMESRFQQMKLAVNSFDFLWGDKLMSKVVNSSIRRFIQDLCSQYPNDFEAATFFNEAQTLQLTIKSFLETNPALNKLGPVEVLNILLRNDLHEAYSNCTTALRIFLTFPVTVASNERSFSKLKIIKNYLRSTMGQERLNGLSILAIEKEVTSTIDFDTVINNFAMQKCRRVKL